nr:hypothetical protein [Streptomyces sp. rh34]
MSPAFRIEDAGRVEGRLEAAQQGELLSPQLGLEVREFRRADTVFAGDGAAQVDRGGEDVGEGPLRASDAVGVVPGLHDAGGVQVAVSGVAEGDVVA